jgi:hypothetical protein
MVATSSYVNDVFAGQSVALQYASRTDLAGSERCDSCVTLYNLVPDVQVHGR